ncbi:hypothetical protein ADUPG1_010861, partial [Aduncisulcus paluster]
MSLSHNPLGDSLSHLVDTLTDNWMTHPFSSAALCVSDCGCAGEVCASIGHTLKCVNESSSRFPSSRPFMLHLIDLSYNPSLLSSSRASSLRLLSMLSQCVSAVRVDLSGVNFGSLTSLFSEGFCSRVRSWTGVKEIVLDDNGFTSVQITDLAYSFVGKDRSSATAGKQGIGGLTGESEQSDSGIETTVFSAFEKAKGGPGGVGREKDVRSGSLMSNLSTAQGIESTCESTITFLSFLDHIFDRRSISMLARASAALNNLRALLVDGAGKKGSRGKRIGGFVLPALVLRTDRPSMDPARDGSTSGRKHGSHRKKKSRDHGSHHRQQGPGKNGSPRSSPIRTAASSSSIPLSLSQLSREGTAGLSSAGMLGRSLTEHSLGKTAEAGMPMTAFGVRDASSTTPLYSRSTVSLSVASHIVPGSHSEYAQKYADMKDSLLQLEKEKDALLNNLRAAERLWMIKSGRDEAKRERGKKRSEELIKREKRIEQSTNLPQSSFSMSSLLPPLPPLSEFSHKEKKDAFDLQEEATKAIKACQERIKNVTGDVSRYSEELGVVDSDILRSIDSFSRTDHKLKELMKTELSFDEDSVDHAEDMLGHGGLDIRGRGMGSNAQVGTESSSFYDDFFIGKPKDNSSASVESETEAHLSRTKTSAALSMCSTLSSSLASIRRHILGLLQSKSQIHSQHATSFSLYVRELCILEDTLRRRLSFLSSVSGSMWREDDWVSYEEVEVVVKRVRTLMERWMSEREREEQREAEWFEKQERVKEARAVLANAEREEQMAFASYSESLRQRAVLDTHIRLLDEEYGFGIENGVNLRGAERDRRMERKEDLVKSDDRQGARKSEASLPAFFDSLTHSTPLFSLTALTTANERLGQVQYVASQRSRFISNTL